MEQNTSETEKFVGNVYTDSHSTKVLPMYLFFAFSCNV